MADLLLTCPNCGKQMPVSEFVSETTATCASCGKEIPIPRRASPAGKGLKLKPLESPTQSTQIPTWPTTGANVGLPVAAVNQPLKQPESIKRENRRIRITRVKIICCWALFIILAVVLAYLRFFSGVPGLSTERLALCGIIAISFFYLVIIILALIDNMFDGLLALVVPLYPFYYLFAVSDAIFLRAVVAALLVGFGYDFGVLLQDIGVRVFNRVNYLIQNA